MTDIEHEAFEKWWHEPDTDSGQSYDDCYGHSTAVVAWLAWSARAASPQSPLTDEQIEDVIFGGGLNEFRLVEQHHAMLRFARMILALAAPAITSESGNQASLPVGELVALRRNARRYQVLRDQLRGFEAVKLQPKQRGGRWRGWGDEGEILEGDALDKAIDAALPPAPAVEQGKEML